MTEVCIFANLWSLTGAICSIDFPETHSIFDPFWEEHLNNFSAIKKLGSSDWKKFHFSKSAFPSTLAAHFLVSGWCNRSDNCFRPTKSFGHHLRNSKSYFQKIKRFFRNPLLLINFLPLGSTKLVSVFMFLGSVYVVTKVSYASSKTSSIYKRKGETFLGSDKRQCFCILEFEIQYCYYYSRLPI